MDGVKELQSKSLGCWIWISTLNKGAGGVAFPARSHPLSTRTNTKPNPLYVGKRSTLNRFCMKSSRCSFWFHLFLKKNWLFAYKGLYFVPFLLVFFTRDSKKSDLYSRLPVSVSIRFEMGLRYFFFHVCVRVMGVYWFFILSSDSFGPWFTRVHMIILMLFNFDELMKQWDIQFNSHHSYRLNLVRELLQCAFWI